MQPKHPDVLFVVVVLADHPHLTSKDDSQTLRLQFSN